MALSEDDKEFLRHSDDLAEERLRIKMQVDAETAELLRVAREVGRTNLQKVNVLTWKTGAGLIPMIEGTLLEEEDGNLTVTFDVEKDSPLATMLKDGKGIYSIGS